MDSMIQPTKMNLTKWDFSWNFSKMIVLLRNIKEQAVLIWT